MVLGGNLDTYLKVLSDVCLEHSLDAFKRIFNREGAKVVHQPIRVQEVGMYHSPFDVIEVSIVFQCLNQNYEISGNSFLRNDQDFSLQFIEWYQNLQTLCRSPAFSHSCATCALS